MAKSAKRVILVGWDGASPPMMERMVKKGRAKNFARLMKRGTFIHALNPFPTITPPNWTTLSTGAWPGRHGITCYNVHHPGDPLDKTYHGFDTKECAVDYIWDAAEKVGKKSIMVHYETSWPPTIKKGFVVGGGGPNSEDAYHTVTPDMVFTTQSYPGSMTEPVKIKQSDGKFSTELKFITTQKERRTYYAEWVKGKKELNIFRDKGRRQVLVAVKEGEWSKPARDKFRYKGKQMEASFLFKLMQLPKTGSGEFSLLCTTIVPTQEFAFPSKIGAELVKALGPYNPRGGWEAVINRSIDTETYLEYMDRHHQWTAKACHHLAKKSDWHILYTQTHCQDYMGHLFMDNYDPLTNRNKTKQRQIESYMDRAYDSADRFLGKVAELADDETLIAVVADHGFTTFVGGVDPSDILLKAGLLKANFKTKVVDWSKTKAVTQRSCHVYVNLKGRDPHGIVKPGREYEDVCDKVIDAFYNYVDPKTKLRPFTLVLKREDARMMGLYGPRVGDIIYALRPEFGHGHGQGLSTGHYGRASLGSVLLLSGPNIKRGQVLKGTTGIQDVVPTMCHMADIPVPRGCEGSIIYDAMEDPNFKLKEKVRLEQELEKWKKAQQTKINITHTY